MSARPPLQPESATSTPLVAVLIVVFLISVGTGVFWNAASFIAKHTFGFSQSRNLLLYAVVGTIYTIGAFGAGRTTRWCERWISPRTQLGLCMVVQVAACACPVLFEGEWTLWVSFAVSSITSSIIWPLMESYMTAGWHGPRMRSVIGAFNLTWMTAVALPLLLMPPILEHHGEWAIGAHSFLAAAAVIPLAWFARRPGHHDPDEADAHVPAEYGALLHSARVLLPLSYVLMAALSPILPYRFEALGADVMVETPMTSIWMLVRVVAVVVMWRMGFWHGRWGTLLGAGFAMTGGFGIIVLAPSLLIMSAGFAVFGIGLAISYYAALYYAMSVGRAEVDAGGTHEGLIGAGYAIGPVAGLIGMAIGGPGAIVGVVWGLVGIGGMAAVHPYVRARRRRNSRIE